MQNQANPLRVKIESRGRGQGTIFQTRGGAYELDFVGSNGKRQRKTLHGAKTITEARKAASALVTKRDQGNDVAPTKMTFTQLAEDFFTSFESMVESGERSSRSLDDYRRRYRTHLEDRLGRVQIAQLTRARALALLDELRSTGAAPATVQAAWKTFVTIVSHGRDRGWLNVDTKVPAAKRLKVRNARKVRILTPEEAANVIHFTKPRWKLLVETAALTGARISELLGLHWSDLSLDATAPTVTIEKQLTRDGQLAPTKTENGVRTIGISEHLRVQLLAAYNAASDKQGFVFATDTKQVGRYRLAARALAKAIEDAGVEFDPETERVSFHCFRHNAASQLIRNNVDPQRVADFLGDTVGTVMSTYVQSVDTDGNLGALLSVAS